VNDPLQKRPVPAFFAALAFVLLFFAATTAMSSNDLRAEETVASNQGLSTSTP
jgi:hypothetical protein